MSSFMKSHPALMGMLLAGTLSPSANGSCEENPFRSERLPGGYRTVADEMAKDVAGRCGEGKSGAKNDKEAVCGIDKVGSAHEDDSKVKEGKCGGHKVVESLCGGDR